MKRKIFACLLASCAVLSACKSENKNAKGDGPPKTPEVGYIQIVPQSSTIKSELSGRVVATLTSEVRPQASGLIKAMLFTEGSFVKAGQPLYQLDTSTYSASLDQRQASLLSAEANLDAARIRANRYRSISDTDAISLQDRDDAFATEKAAIAAVKLAQANLRSSQIDLRYTTVRAPISGYISASNYTVGALVTASQASPLATIRALDPIYVDVEQSATEILKMRKSMAAEGKVITTAPVTIKTEDGSTHPHQGILQFSERMVDAATGSVTLRAKVPNPEGYLLPGMFVKVEVPQYEIADAILIPQQGAAIGTGNKGSAYIINAQNKAETREITMEQAIGNQWLITSGLKAGDKVIVEGRDKVKPGGEVKPVAVKIPTSSDIKPSANGK